MKVYAAVGGWDYEGHDRPIGIYSTEALAREALRLGYGDYDYAEVVEFTIDDLRAWPKIPEHKVIEVV